MPNAHARVPCARCATLIRTSNRTGLCQLCFRAAESLAHPRFTTPPPSPSVALPIEAQVAADRVRTATLNDQTVLRLRYAQALKEIERLERETSAFRRLTTEAADPITITPHQPSGTSEGTVCWVASDWHVEETVDTRTVSGLNTFNLDIAQARGTQFFQAGLRLTNLLAHDIHVSTIVLGLLGDFISNDIHDEVAELAALPPMHAVSFTRNLLIGGIEFVLNHSTYSLVIPCHSGNHGRTTHKTRFSNENGHSLEYLLYAHLADYFRSEPRVRFLISEGYHSYLAVYDKTLRFHHGHAVKYGGGVGGITIPTNKAIGQWNQARRADLDIFGHFHQSIDGGKFLCNGSLIGYNAFALSIKAEYEPPQQTLFLLDKTRGRTCRWPILFSQ